MRYSVVTDLSRRILWGQQGNQWHMLSSDVEAVKPYDGERLLIEIVVGPGDYTMIEKCTGFALHRDTGNRPDQYRVEDICSMFLKLDVITDQMHDGTGYRSLSVSLSDQHVSYLISPQ